MLFYRQNTCDISKCDKTSCSCSFEEAANKCDVFLMDFFLFGRGTEQGIPFVDNDDESVSCGLIDVVQRFGDGERTAFG